ncbi:MAG TPA: zinc ribbon domain-containing protein [bacterium]|nr:zinc ribbon domain-containing protein [bacterium]
MPTYDYSCEKCGNFELWQSIKDNALSACPKCGSKVERLISANVGFVLKGAGFYQNDYKNPSTPSDRSGQAPSMDSTSSGQGCGACGSPDPCPNN